MKILAIASVGGHWVQLLRITKGLRDVKITYVTTNGNFKNMVEGSNFFSITDGSRWSKLKLILSFLEVFKIIYREKPAVIITTGAAPGLMAILSGKLLGIRTVWIDSVANVDELSMSGKIALKFANRVYTQWPNLATDKIIYAGNVF
jgi:UDP-N-acetylglucosamine:LPS N-acetylglucosamine transferase